MAVAERTKPKRALPAEPFSLEHFRAWAARQELDNEQPWLLEPWQERFAEDVFARIPLCWLVVPEGNGKTTFVAGLALYIIEFKPSAYVPVAASARDQAEWVYRQAEGFVYRGGRDGEFKCLEGYRRIRFDAMGASRIQVFAADDRSGDGVIPGGIAILDELHRHRDLKLYETWKGKLNKRKAQLIVISTAGEVGSEFEQERSRLRSSGDVEIDGAFVRAVTMLGEKPLAVIHDYALPDDGNINDLEQVKGANPSATITLETLAEKRELVGNDQHWSRFTCNRASRHVSAAVSEGQWLSATSLERIPAGEPVVLGADFGWKDDVTAFVPLWVRDFDFRLFGAATIVEPPRDGSITNPRLLEDALRLIHDRNPIRTVVMDLTDAEQFSVWIEEEFGCEVVDRAQSPKLMAMDYSRFIEGLAQGQLFHSGDPGLTRHVLNAVAKVNSGGNIVFERPSSTRHGRERVRQTREIDALVAAAMVYNFAAAELSAPALVGWKGL